MIGSRLDTIARAPLWAVGMDFNHGTGHGVGSYLCVHEGPQGIGFRRRPGGEEVSGYIYITSNHDYAYYVTTLLLIV
jgi:Xaa-Pro aminopeptidase